MKTHSESRPTAIAIRLKSTLRAFPYMAVMGMIWGYLAAADTGLIVGLLVAAATSVIIPTAGKP